MVPLRALFPCLARPTFPIDFYTQFLFSNLTLNFLLKHFKEKIGYRENRTDIPNAHIFMTISDQANEPLTKKNSLIHIKALTTICFEYEDNYIWVSYLKIQFIVLTFHV